MTRRGRAAIAIAVLLLLTGCTGTVRDFSPKEATHAPAAGATAAPAGDYSASWCPLQVDDLVATLKVPSATVKYADWTSRTPPINKRNCTYTLPAGTLGAETVVIWSALNEGLVGLPPSAERALDATWAKGKAVADPGRVGYELSWKKDGYYFAVQTDGPATGLPAGVTTEDAEAASRTAAVTIATRVHDLGFPKSYWTHR